MSHKVRSASATLIAMVLCLASAITLAAGQERFDSSVPEVQLKAGSIGSYHYTVKSHRGLGSTGSTQPCISNGFGLGEGTQGRPTKLTICGMLVPNGLVLASAKKGGGRKEVTILTMVFERSVHQVHLSLSGQPDQNVSLKLLSTGKAKKAGLRRYRYAVLAFSGPYCLSHITGFNQRGAVVIDTTEMSCRKMST